MRSKIREISKDLFKTKIGQYRIEVTTKGVTIWDDTTGLWIMDASCLTEDNAFEVASSMKFKRGINRGFEVRKADIERHKPTAGEGV